MASLFYCVLFDDSILQPLFPIQALHAAFIVTDTAPYRQLDLPWPEGIICNYIHLNPAIRKNHRMPGHL